MSDLWTRLDFGFFAPVWLYVGLVAVVAVILLEIGAQRRRRQALHLFAASHLVPELTGSVSSRNRVLKRVLLITAVGLLFVAMARPHLLFKWSEEIRSGLDVFLAVDCSKSMLTEDVKPNRIERAKLAVEDFADRLPDNRLGLIAFAGDAFLECPLTLDHQALQSAVRDLDTDTIPRPGTDIASAIDLAVTAAKSQPANMKFLILITDGEDLEGRVLDAAKSAAQNGLKIYTVGVGTANGGLIPERDEMGGESVLRDATGQIVQSKLDENTLRQIASITGGAYAPLGQRGEGLEEIYDRYIAPLPKQHLQERREKIRYERFEWPLGLAILCLVAEFLIRDRAATTLPPVPTPPRRSLRRPARAATVAVTRLLATALVLSGGIGMARAANSDTAERDYKSGKYEDSAEKYREALEAQPNRHELQYDHGDAAYRAGEYNEAEEAFRQALETPNLNLQEDTYYNLGNTQFKHGEAMQKVDPKRTQELWEQALHSYESALKLKDASDTKYNYEVVKKKLEQLKQQQQQQQNKNDQQSSDNNGQSGQNPQSGQGKDESSQGQKDQPPQNNGQSNSSGEPNQSGNSGQEKNAQQQPSDKNAPTQMKARSGERGQDQQDPGIKSREEAEALLDSLKDDEQHVTARALNGNNDQPPPPSGKDW
jgi:Ca-activated chloride channel family protein